MRTAEEKILEAKNEDENKSLIKSLYAAYTTINGVIWIDEKMYTEKGCQMFWEAHEAIQKAIAYLPAQNDNDKAIKLKILREIFTSAHNDFFRREDTSSMDHIEKAQFEIIKELTPEYPLLEKVGA